MSTLLVDAVGDPGASTTTDRLASADTPRGLFPTCETAPDVLVQKFGTITILWPRTDEAKGWFAENVDTQHTWGAGTVCEPRYVEPIVEGLMEAGFHVIHN